MVNMRAAGGLCCKGKRLTCVTFSGHGAQGGRQTSFNGIQPCVMNLSNILACLATFGKRAAFQKEVIAGFPGLSNRQEDVSPGVKPAGLIFCPRPINIAVQPDAAVWSAQPVPVQHRWRSPACTAPLPWLVSTELFNTAKPCRWSVLNTEVVRHGRL